MPTERVDGEVVEALRGGPERNYVRDEILADLKLFLRHSRLGHVFAGTEFTAGPFNTRRPDLLFISAARWRPGMVRGSVLDLVPELVIEIISPDDPTSDLRRRARDYYAAGVQTVWIIDLGATNAPVLTAPCLPGFSLRPDELFARIPA